MTTRAEIVSKAREFLGTPFRHQGRAKGVASDCVGIPLMVAQELGLSDKNGQVLHGALYAQYAPQPAGNFVHTTVAQHLEAKSLADIKPGDVITLRVPRDPCHVAVVAEIPGQGLSMIHAYAPNESVVENLIDEKWRARIVGVFSFPGVED